MNFRFPWNGKENAVYGVRLTRHDSHGVEYVFLGHYAFGRVWDASADIVIGYWFNRNPESMKEIKGKLGSTPLRKTIAIDKARLRRIKDIGKNHNNGYYITAEEYRSLVDAVIEESGSLF